MVSNEVNTFSYHRNFDQFCNFVIWFFCFTFCVSKMFFFYFPFLSFECTKIMFYQTNRFNDTESDKATGRSIDVSQPFPFPLKNSVYPVYDKTSNHRSNSNPKIVYASSIPVQRTDRYQFIFCSNHFSSGYVLFISRNCSRQIRAT